MSASPHTAARGHALPLTAQPALLVIGYGNPLRGDDGVGWQVGQQLASELSLDDVAVLTVHQLTPELAEPIGRSRLVVFVDAREGDVPGQVDAQPVELADEPGLTFSHDVNPSVLLAMARALYGTCPAAVVVSVAGDDFGYGVGLSRVVQAALPEVLWRVRNVLETGPDAAGVARLERVIAAQSRVERPASAADRSGGQAHA